MSVNGACLYCGRVTKVLNNVMGNRPPNALICALFCCIILSHVNLSCICKLGAESES